MVSGAPRSLGWDWVRWRRRTQQGQHRTFAPYRIDLPGTQFVDCSARPATPSRFTARPAASSMPNPKGARAWPSWMSRWRVRKPL